MASATEEETLEDFILENYPHEERLEEVEESADTSSEARSSYTFKEWIRSIRSSKASLPQGPLRFVADWPEDETLDDSYRMFPQERISRDDASFMTSSSFLHGVKTASMSLTSMSILNRARSNTLTSSHHRSSTLSGSDPRKSIDSNKLGSSFPPDETAWNYAVHRYRVIQELVDTEISYISTLKNLSQVGPLRIIYHEAESSFILTSSQGLSLVLIAPPGAHQSIDTLITLHEGLLEKLQNRSMTSGRSTNFLAVERVRRSNRGNGNSTAISTSGTNGRLLNPKKLRDSRIRSPTVTAASPTEAAEVACILELPRFLAYKEYLMKYPLVQNEIDRLRQSKQNWQAYDQGLEALFRTVQPFSSREKCANHARTISDLLIQPVQRLCKYQLFLTDLMRCTPSTQCSTAHETIQRVHKGMLAVTKEINSGAADPIALDRLRKTMELQKRLEFPSNQKIQEYCDILKLYGSIKVCGVLHIAYQTSEVVTGSYMVCALFESYVLLAISSSDREKFKVMAIIFIRGSRLEEAANGIGLHCPGTPYSWKLIFSFRHDLVELVFTACSEKEETEWLRNFLTQINPETDGQLEAVHRLTGHSKVYFTLKPLQAVIVNGRLLSIARRTSIHGTLITMASPDYLPIHIKGTTAFPPANQTTRPPLGRSQSMQCPRREVILTPKRQKRFKLERRLVDIWTRDIIPYPGMALGIGESLMRTSTDVLMGRFTGLPPFARRTNSNRTPARNKSVERFTIPKQESDKGETEPDEAMCPPPSKEAYQDDDLDKCNLENAIMEASPSPRRGFMSLRKKQSTLTKRARGDFPNEIRRKASKPSLRKRLSVALFKSNSPSKSRRDNTVEV
ncbi:hypothetical protein PRK78_007045 [Emydomyces testavorans]|uniref:DH domain-containing protein n=1 Tax=Emydomyces testavorans TaxID=2070801 RepID=A0AAF0IL30_9EURO|nr:hypothetical protein PRK78_007045 [Emydomyces testavorans]